VPTVIGSDWNPAIEIATAGGWFEKRGTSRDSRLPPLRPGPKTRDSVPNHFPGGSGTL